MGWLFFLFFSGTLSGLFFYTIKAERTVLQVGLYNNPYQQMYNPYGYNQMSMQNAGMQQAAVGQITRVNGRNGADAFRMAPNSSILLMDENDPIVWLKQTDGAGYATVTPYTVTPYQAAPPVDVSDLESRVKRLEDILNGKPNDGNAGQKRKAE